MNLKEYYKSILLESMPGEKGFIDGNRRRDSSDRHMEDVMERAASDIHTAWMSRNPRQDWNATLHVPYEELPEHEKEKDREHVRLVTGVLRTKHPNSQIAQDERNHPMIADQVASILHERWREGHRSKGDVPRMKKISTGGEVDINVPWKDLHPEWKQENLAAGLAAVSAYKTHFLTYNLD